MLRADAGGVVHGDRVRDELAVIGGYVVAVGELACNVALRTVKSTSGTGLGIPVS
jgi:hypothetical protein